MRLLNFRLRGFQENELSNEANDANFNELLERIEAKKAETNKLFSEITQ